MKIKILLLFLSLMNLFSYAIERKEEVSNKYPLTPEQRQKIIKIKSYPDINNPPKDLQEIMQKKAKENIKREMEADKQGKKN